MIKGHKGLFFTASNKVIWLKKNKFYAFTPKILSRMPFKYSRAIIIDASIISPPHNEAEIVLKLHSNLHIQSWGPNLFVHCQALIVPQDTGMFWRMFSQKVNFEFY